MQGYSATTLLPGKVRCAYTYFMELESNNCSGLDSVMAELEAACWSPERKRLEGQEGVESPQFSGN
jgi:hypothetical protein